MQMLKMPIAEFYLGVGHVVGILPREQLATVIRQICWAQIQPLLALCDVRCKWTFLFGTLKLIIIYFYYL